MNRSLCNCLLILAVLAAGCPMRQGRAPLPDPPARLVEAGDGPLDPAALADEIDPGPLSPLLRDLPDFARQALGLDGVGRAGPQAVAELARAIIADWSRSPAPAIDLQHLEPVFDFLRRLAVLEIHDANGAPCDADCLAVRAGFYSLLDIPWFAERDNFFGQVFALVGPALGRDPGARRQAEALAAFLQRVFAEAPRHLLRTAARLLRQAPDSPQATEVLGRLAARADRLERFARARRLYRLVVERTAGEVPFDRWVDLAGACYRSLQLDCGDEALARARSQAGPSPDRKLREQLDSLESVRRIAARVRGLDRPEGLAGRLRLAGDLIDLGHLQTARQFLEKLRAARPRDARPYTGLARVALADKLHAGRAAGLIRAAAGLDNKDQAYYEAAVGLAFGAMVEEVMKPAMADPERLPALMVPFLARVRKDIAGLAAFEPARAAVLDLLVDFGSRFLVLSGRKDGPARDRSFARLLREATEQARTLQAEHPGEVDAIRLLLLLARCSSDRQTALGLLGTELPAGLAGRVGLLRATALRAWAAVRQEPALVAEARAALLAEPPEPTADEDFDRAELEVELAALEARQRSSRPLWREVERGLRKLLAEAETKQLARLHNNLGVALHELGRGEEAVDEWSAAVRAGAEKRVPELNLLAAAPAGDRRARLERLAEGQGDTVVGYQARAWALYLAKAPPEALARTLAGLERELQRKDFLCPLGDGGAGLLVADDFQLGFGYSITGGLTTSIGLAPRGWLLLPAPPTRKRS